MAREGAAVKRPHLLFVGAIHLRCAGMVGGLVGVKQPPPPCGPPRGQGIMHVTKGRFLCRIDLRVDVEDLIIVDSEDVLLIMNKDKDQDLKHLVDIIKEDGKFNKYI